MPVSPVCHDAGVDLQHPCFHRLESPGFLHCEVAGLGGIIAQVVELEAGLWTGNSRVVSAEDNARFGNGGYALGARAMQIRDRLFEKQQFNEGDFYQLQLDNQARFLTPWHGLLLEQLKQQPEHYADYINALDNWQQCACSTSVGYTLVKMYRDELINILFSSIEASLNKQDGTLSYVKRDLEPAVWQLIKAQPASWINPQFTNWEQQLQGAFEQTLAQLTAKFGNNIQNWQWGKVNELAIEHPFAKQIPLLSKLLNMPTAPGFGDSYMPAVQKTSFGASQRFIAQPGHLESAILTVPGGQSEGSYFVLANIEGKSCTS